MAGKRGVKRYRTIVADPPWPFRWSGGAGGAHRNATPMAYGLMTLEEIKALIVAAGKTSGERMHKARHTAGQFILDKTGNLSAAQSLLMHESIQTTGDIYTDWDDERLAITLAEIYGEDE